MDIREKKLKKMAECAMCARMLWVLCMHECVYNARAHI